MTLSQNFRIGIFVVAFESCIALLQVVEYKS